MLAPNVIVLEYVCPLLGMIAANIMFAAPLQSVRNAIAHGTLGSLNPTPWAFMTGNCIGWVTYSFLINNLFLLLANAPGLILSVWLNMAAAKLQYCDRVSHSMRSSFVQLLDDHRRSFRIPSLTPDVEQSNDNEEQSAHNASSKGHEQRPTLPTDNDDPHTFTNIRKMALDITIQKTSIPAPHEKVVVTIVSFYVILISTLMFLQLTTEQWKTIVGFVVNINLLFFYGAPLSTIYTVITTRDSSSIHRPTMLLNTANAVFWTAFGFGVLDWFIIVPNGLGAILGAIQMVLRVIVPCRDELVVSSAVDGSAAGSSALAAIGAEETKDVELATSSPSTVMVDDSN